MAGVTLLYVVVQLAYSASGIGESDAPLADLAAQSLGPVGALLLGITAIVSVLANQLSAVTSISRITSSFADQGLLPRWFGRISPRFATPSNSILAVGGIGLALALSGTFVTLAVISTVARLCECDLRHVLRQIGNECAVRRLVTSVTERSPDAVATDPAQPGGLVRTIVVLGSMIAIAPLTIDLYLPALPSITTDLMTDATSVQLTLTGTLIGLAVGQVLIGPLSDALGRRRPLIAGLATHVVASLFCVVAPNIAVLGRCGCCRGSAPRPPRSSRPPSCGTCSPDSPRRRYSPG